jgi:hypothetical protein
MGANAGEDKALDMGTSWVKRDYNPLVRSTIGRLTTPAEMSLWITWDSKRLVDTRHVSPCRSQGITTALKNKAPKERDMSTISRGSETLHPVKPNLRFIIGVKGAGM